MFVRLMVLPEMRMGYPGCSEGREGRMRRAEWDWVEWAPQTDRAEVRSGLGLRAVRLRRSRRSKS